MFFNSSNTVLPGLYRSYSDLLKLLYKSNKPYNIPIINKAYEFAFAAHASQKRRTGDDYIFHPISVAYILVELGMDTPTVAAALLHDVVEDTNVSNENIEKIFGKEIAVLVEGVTELKRSSQSTQEEKQAENIGKMLKAMANDIRVIIIKLADRLQNMRTIDIMSPQSRRDKSLQCMEIFAPIAHRLGIRAIKDELEDISLKYLDPVAFSEVESILALQKKDREKFINLTKKRILDKLKRFFPNIYISGRVKSLNEIYKKIFVRGKSVKELYDVYGIRIIVDTPTECYNILGIMHDMFQPMPNRFKDYISTPRPNMYQSLHTTVFSKEGIPFEIQIRTWKMDKTAEFGIAAHWKYKLDEIDKNKALKGSLAWVNKMIENYQEIGNVSDFVGNIKLDLVPDVMHTFTPKGKVVNLPQGATVIDFAYAIHTELGNKIIGATVNNRDVPVAHVLKEGNVVKIITTSDEKYGPDRSWLGIVKTGEAKNKIKRWLRNEKREENICCGKKEIESLLEINKIFLTEKALDTVVIPFLEKNKCKNPEDLYAAVGYGGVSAWNLVSNIKNVCQKDESDRFLERTRKQKNLTEISRKIIVKFEVIAKKSANFLPEFTKKACDLKVDFRKLKFNACEQFKIKIIVEAEFENEKSVEKNFQALVEIENIESVNRVT